MTQEFPNRTWAEIDLDILAENMREIRRITSPQAEIMAVVKADAYGHGAVQVAKILLENGASRLAVSMLEEAIELRKHGFTVPILILSHMDLCRIPEIIFYDLTQTVYEGEFADALSREAERENKTVRIHVKVDTGMGRIGYLIGDDSTEEILRISRLPGIMVEGLFTHFATSDEPDTTYVELQFERFISMVARLKSRGLSIPIQHVCNSAGILRFPHMHLDMVRAGLILYGMIPKGCPDAYQPISLMPAMTLKSSIIHVKDLPDGCPVSYGRNFVTTRQSVIATIPIGYADGYARRLSNRAEVLVHGQRAQVVGNVCMDMCMIDVTDFEERPHIQEEVVLFGTQKIGSKTFSLPVDELSDLLDTINYEITCLVGKRVPRVYLQSDDTAADAQLYLVGFCGWDTERGKTWKKTQK
jgi:alanine racemase